MTATSDLVSIRPHQSGADPYDPRKPLPYPWHIEPDGAVWRQDFWRGEYARLAGFQKDVSVQHVDLLTEDWLAGDVQAAVGMYPVFFDAKGGMFNDTRAISDVTDYRKGASDG